MRGGPWFQAKMLFLILRRSLDYSWGCSFEDRRGRGGLRFRRSALSKGSVAYWVLLYLHSYSQFSSDNFKLVDIQLWNTVWVYTSILTQHGNQVVVRYKLPNSEFRNVKKNWAGKSKIQKNSRYPPDIRNFQDYFKIISRLFQDYFKIN